MIKKTQFGTPITIINGGINAIIIERLNPHKPILPKAQITEINTTTLHCKTTLNERKNIYNRREEASIDNAKKMYISLTILFPTTTRMCGNPAK